MDDRQQKQMSTMASSLLVKYLTVCVSFRGTADIDSSFQPRNHDTTLSLNWVSFILPIISVCGQGLLPFFGD